MGGNSLGGSTKINAMLYTRGIPAEYNAWKAAGRHGWAYDDLRQLFVQSEKDLDQQNGSKDDIHGREGKNYLMRIFCSANSVTGEWVNRSHKERYWSHTAL